MSFNPYDGGGVNLNPRPVGRNPQPRNVATTRRPRKAWTDLTIARVGRHDRRVVGASATVQAAFAARRTDLTTSTPRSRMLYG